MLAICVEASHQRGLGHLFRALVLRAELAARGIEPLIVVNDDARARAILADAGAKVESAPLDDASTNWEADLIGDHGITLWLDDRLLTDERHARRVREEGARLVTMEDRGPGAALADLHIAPLARAGDQVPGSRVLRGLEYLVLDPEIGRYRRQRQSVASIVVSMGGADTWNLAPRVAELVDLAWPQVPITVILGPSSEVRPDQLPARCSVKRGVPSLAAEFHAHDLAFTAGGMTPFEAAAAGLPTVVIAAEPHETENALLLQALGASRYAGFRMDIDRQAIGSPGNAFEMSSVGMAAVTLDGARRVCDALLGG